MKPSSTAARAAALLALLVSLLVGATPATAGTGQSPAPATGHTGAQSATAGTGGTGALADCITTTYGPTATATCVRLASGEQWRVRADCPFAIDQYSDWTSAPGTRSARCPYGSARDSIVQLR